MEINMKYYGIKTPKSEKKQSYIWWIADSEYMAWMSFFQYPNKEGERIPHRLCLADAKRAYKAIGYKCVELDVKEINNN